MASELVERGHRVRFLTGSRHSERIEATGVEFLPLPASADFGDRDMAAAFPQTTHLTGIRSPSAAVLEVFAKQTDAQFAAVTETLATELTDVISPRCCSPACACTRSRCSRARSAPAVGVLGISPMTLKAPGLPPYGPPG